MKQGHFFLVFVLIYLSCFLTLYAESKEYSRIQKEKTEMERILLDAIESAGDAFCAVIQETEEKKKQVFSEAFFEGLCLLSGNTNTAEGKEQWMMYVPMLVLLEEDGFFLCYVREVKENGVTKLCHEWTNKIAFEFDENASEEQRSSIMSETLEQTASEIITNHNAIALQYGISYRYSAPRFLQDTSTPLEFPMLFVVFQGWPLNPTGTLFYENCIDAGVFLRQKNRTGNTN